MAKQPLSEKRKAAILESLKAGNKIRRRWNGPNQGGYLMHELEGVPRLRASEVEALDRLLFHESGRAGGFGSLRLRTTEDDEADAKRKADREAAEAARQQEQQEKRERASDIAAFLPAAHFQNVTADGDVVTFERKGHKFRVEEMEGIDG